MFGIINAEKKFISLGEDRENIRTGALLSRKEETIVVTDYDEDGNKIGQHEETRFVPMFTEETVDEEIKEYAETDIEKAYTGEYYLAGFAPQQSVEEKNEQIRQTRAALYTEHVDPLHAQKAKDIIMGEWSDEKEQEYIAKVKELTIKIRNENPYIEVQ